MVRCAVVMACLVLGASALIGEDKDPVREKLFAAKAAYDEEMRAYRKQAGEWFAAREAEARKAGNKKLVDQVKAEQAAFDEGGNCRGAPRRSSRRGRPRQGKSCRRPTNRR